MRLHESTALPARLHAARARRIDFYTAIHRAMFFARRMDCSFSCPKLISRRSGILFNPSRIPLLMLLCFLSFFAQMASASSPKVGELIKLYDQSVAKLERSIGTAKAHRTALIEQMDALGNDLKGVETAAIKTNVKNPSLQSELDQLNLDLAKIEGLLQEKTLELKQQQAQASKLPIPGVVADALADETALKHHRELALWQYRLHLKKRKIAAISNRKQKLLGTIDDTVSRNDAVRNSIEKLTDQQKSLNREKQTLEERFANLSVDIVRKQDRIQRMRLRKRHLLESSDKSLDFSRVRGSLPDPVEGTLHKRFAEPKAEGLLQWEGILVKAQLGQEIEAVFDGQVVFVGKIQGLGNVAIIDHDKEYMSLYGMAELLVVEETQTVIAGQVIGTVGESAAIDSSALYFEIRHNAKTVDPEEWLSMQLITSDPVE